MHGALLEVYHMILFQKERSTRDGQPNAWRNTRHVVILLTDGGDSEGTALGWVLWGWAELHLLPLREVQRWRTSPGCGGQD